MAIAVLGITRKRGALSPKSSRRWLNGTPATTDTMRLPAFTASLTSPATASMSHGFTASTTTSASFTTSQLLVDVTTAGNCALSASSLPCERLLTANSFSREKAASAARPLAVAPPMLPHPMIAIFIVLRICYSAFVSVASSAGASSSLSSLWKSLALILASSSSASSGLSPIRRFTASRPCPSLVPS